MTLAVTSTPTLPSPSVRYERTDSAVGILTLDRATTRNALGPAEWHALGRHLSFIAADESVRVVILTGAGGAFSSGGDLHSMPARLALPPVERQARLRAEAQVIQQLYHLDQPTIAVIPGACVGAGLSLALACDLRLCSENARLGATFHRVGLSGDFGLTWLLPRVVGPARAMEMLLCAEVYEATKAAALGLVHRVLPAEELDSAARAMAEQISAGPPLAQAMTKRSVHRGLACDLASMLEWEAMAQAILSKTEDASEGVRAFSEKRKPAFHGR